MEQYDVCIIGGGLSGCLAALLLHKKGIKVCLLEKTNGAAKINSPAWDTFAPYGGYKQFGNGREYADWGIHDFVEVKALIGFGTELGVG